MKHPSIAQVLCAVGTRCDPAVLVERLQVGFKYKEVIEGIQRAMEWNYIMFDKDAYVVPHDGKYYND